MVPTITSLNDSGNLSLLVLPTAMYQGLQAGQNLFEGLIPKGSCILSHTPLYTCFMLVIAS